MPGFLAKKKMTRKGFLRRYAKSRYVSFRAKARKKGTARPMRSLSAGYLGQPNQYRFVRETRPTIVDMGATGSGVSLIAGTGAIPNISVLSFPNFSIDQLAGGFSEFSNLFANYKIDKIETILVPQWSQNTQQSINPSGAVWTQTAYVPNLMLTRINTKYLVNGLTLSGTAEGQRDELAQIQKKTRSLYGTKKWLKIITPKPRVFMELEDGAGGQNLVTRPSPWLPSVQAADQEYSMNDILFADKLDGTDFSAGIYKYRMYHRIHFRCSFVG